jgi:tetratricopeptide (TPR) repeat protein
MNARSFLSLPLLAVLFFAVGSAVGQPASWLGQTILYVKPYKEIQFRSWVDGKEVSFPFSGRLPLRVREERDNLLLIHDGSQEGWVNKADFVLLRDATAYFQKMVQSNPKDAWALNMCGQASLQSGDLDAALKDFDECLRLHPAGTEAYRGRGNTHYAKRDYDRAIKDYDEAIRLSPTDATTFVYRGISWEMQNDFDRALKDYDEAIRLDPRCGFAFLNRGDVWRTKRDYDKAIQSYSEAIRLDPKDAFAILSRANTRRLHKEFDKAVQDCDEAIRLHPNYSLAFLTRGEVHWEKKDYEQAFKDYDDAVRVEPRNETALNQLAWRLATCTEERYRNGVRAVSLAYDACEITQWKNANTIDTLAAAYAEAELFDQAVRRQKQALEFADFAKVSGERARERLKLYEKNEAYRE